MDKYIELEIINDCPKISNLTKKATVLTNAIFYVSEPEQVDFKEVQCTIILNNGKELKVTNLSYEQIKAILINNEEE